MRILVSLQIAKSQIKLYIFRDIPCLNTEMTLTQQQVLKLQNLKSIYLRNRLRVINRNVNVISNEPSFKNRHFLITSVSLKSMSEQLGREYYCFSILKLSNTVSFLPYLCCLKIFAVFLLKLGYRCVNQAY